MSVCFLLVEGGFKMVGCIDHCPNLPFGLAGLISFQSLEWHCKYCDWKELFERYSDQYT